jgi:hypothetical protein
MIVSNSQIFSLETQWITIYSYRCGLFAASFLYGLGQVARFTQYLEVCGVVCAAFKQGYFVIYLLTWGDYAF